jgi:plastocyanin
MRPSALLVALPALAVLALAGCGGDDGGAVAAASSPDTVIVRNLRYSPKTLTVDAGDAVTWSFDDGNIPHDVKGEGFKSPTKTDGTWSHTFATAGTYDYHCSLHPYMKGSVEVRG